jgi:hypothetical protein
MGRDIWICWRGYTSSQFNTESVMEDLYYVFNFPRRPSDDRPPWSLARQ